MATITAEAVYGHFARLVNDGLLRLRGHSIATFLEVLMKQSEIYAKLTGIFHDLFDDSSIVISPEMTANDVRDWDSFNHINLIVSIEAEFRIKFQTAELEAIHNVGTLVDRIEKKLAEQGR